MGRVSAPFDRIPNFDLKCSDILAQYIIFNRIMRKQSKRTKQSKQKSASTTSKTKPVTKSKSKNLKRKPTKEQIEEQPQVELALDYKVEQDGTKFKVKIHKNYQIDCQSKIGKKIVAWVALLTKKQKLKSDKLAQITSYTYYPTFQFDLAGEKPEHEKCSICQFEYESMSLENMQKQLTAHSDTDLVMLKCSHIMHYECLKELTKAQDWVKCPVCSSIYGKMLGDQPPGKMTYVVNKLIHCDGYPECGTIMIDYNMFAGKRGDINFPGTHRVGYLPDNKEGNEVLALLREAFERKLIFTIGRSVTTGRDNQIVWNGIHHKTNLSGGSAYFGYPDPTYFSRVKLELAAKGVY